MFSVKKLSDEITNSVVCPDSCNYIEISNGSNRCVLIQKYADLYADKIKNFKVYEDDIWVVTFPKCGTTWTQEMVWLLNNDMDYETALNTPLRNRFPFIEIGGTSHLSDVDTFNICNELKRQRHIKSHLPVFLLPNELWTVKPKIIYVVRNPKDAAISYYHHYRHLHGYAGTREDFINAYLNDKVVYSPINEHALEFWKLSQENSNILFLFYEDMKKDLDAEVKRVAKFLGKNYSQKQVDKACDHLSIDSMRKNPMCNGETSVKILKTTRNYESKDENFRFIREGVTGSHKKEMTEDEIKRFDEYMNNEEFKKFEFSYKN